MDIKKLDNQELVFRYEKMVAAMYAHLGRNDMEQYDKYANICYEIKQEILRRMNNRKVKN